MPRKKNSVVKSGTFEGKRFFASAPTEREALIKLANKRRDLEENKNLVSHNMTIKAWAIKMFSVYKYNIKEISRKKQWQIMRHNILEVIGDMKLKDVKSLHCKSCLNLLNGHSQAHIDITYQLLSALFKHAIDNDLLNKSPMANLAKPMGYKHHHREITHKEREAVLAVCNRLGGYFDLFLFMLSCGCRPAEVIAIKHNDLSLRDGAPLLHIRGQKTDRFNKLSDRFVPCPHELYNKYKAASFDFIFKTSSGKPITSNDYRRIVERLYREMNIEMGCAMYRNALIPPFPLAKDFVPYCLRHTYCSDLARKGVDVRIAQKLMGHADIKTTANIYTHVTQEDVVLKAAQILGYKL